jgi:hypothetical protein
MVRFFKKSATSRNVLNDRPLRDRRVTVTMAAKNYNDANPSLLFSVLCFNIKHGELW